MNPNNDVSDAEDVRGARPGILRLTPTEWLVRDSRLADDDPAALIGVIKALEDCFEVTKLGVLTTRWIYRSFDQAKASLIESVGPRTPVAGRSESRVTD